MSTPAIDHLLDRFVPLRNASHADVLRYSVEIPKRYCECSASLANGSKTALLNPRAFAGWSSNGRERSYLFRRGNRFMELSATADESGNRDLPVRLGRLSVRQLDRGQMIPMPQGCKDHRMFIGVDGGLFVLYSDNVVPARASLHQTQGVDGGQRFQVTAG